MITAQDIREKTFAPEKRGYNQAEVDEFLESLAADVTSTQKDYNTLRGKMKVLVDKIEEYRSNEDAMRLALVSAQKVAKEVEDEANVKAEAIIAEAQARAESIIAEAENKAQEIAGDLITRREIEEKRLAAAREASSDYISRMQLICEKQSEFLKAVREMDAADTASSAEAGSVPEEAAAEPEQEVVPEAEEEVDEPTRMFRF